MPELMNATPATLTTEKSAGANRVGGPMVMHARVITGVGGGPDKTILNSPRFLRRTNYRCVCLYLRDPQDANFGAIRERARQWQAPLVEIDDGGPFDWRVVSRTLAACREHDVRIWHGHDYKSNLLGLLLRRWWPMHLVTTAHGWVERTRRTPLYYRLDAWSLPRYERVICVSEDIQQQCRDFGVSDEKSILIENAIDTEEFSRTASVDAAKQRLDWPQERFLIGAAGRLSDEKGFDILVHSIRELVDRGLNVGLVIAGEGKEREALEQLVAHLGLKDRVRLLGFQSDLRPLYEAMDVFALSSRREGLPNVVLEAMALQTPVVSTRVAGVPRLIEDGKNGLLVDLNDQTALTAALERAIMHPELRAALAASARQTIEARYSFAVRMQKVAAVYDDLLSNDVKSCPAR
jgi:glycosyltransferase involved in cell wall biosynthesis